MRGVVIIGRNEGDRLRSCLESLGVANDPVVYVDSGSTDGSVKLALKNGTEVLELDMSRPFTAARARNAGLRRLRELSPRVEYVQFVDADCELAEHWLEKAESWLDRRADVAAVCGRLKEKHPERTIYNLLCDIEWDRPSGDAKSCGGIAMMRVAALDAVGGYREDLIAGEEPELCVRLRAAGWRVSRLAEPMAQHDAALLRFGQWWRRTLRGGYAFAQGAALHGRSPERHCVRESRSIWLWALGVPLLIAGSVLVVGGSAWWLLLVYPAQVVRLALRGGRGGREDWVWAGFTVLGKFPELAGQLKFLTNRYLGRHARLIEHK